MKVEGGSSSPPNGLLPEPLLGSPSVLGGSVDLEDPDEVEDEDGPEERDGAVCFVWGDRRKEGGKVKRRKVRGREGEERREEESEPAEEEG